MQITRGDSFLLALIAKVDGVGQDLTDWEVRASLGKGGAVIDDLAVGFTDRANGEFTLSADTADWPVGVASFDIRYVTDTGQIATTDPVSVVVRKGVTP